jgi:hypothetical protein
VGSFEEGGVVDPWIPFPSLFLPPCTALLLLRRTYQLMAVGTVGGELKKCSRLSMIFFKKLSTPCINQMHMIGLVEIQISFEF